MARNWDDIVSNLGFLDVIAKQVTEWRIDKGFVTPAKPDSDMLGKLMLVVSEISEAAEACRDEDMDNFQEEIADTFIRLFDICGTVGFSIEDAIIKKMKKNEERPTRHGRKSAI